MFEHERDRNRLLEGDSFVNMAAFAICSVTRSSRYGGRHEALISQGATAVRDAPIA